MKCSEIIKRLMCFFLILTIGISPVYATIILPVPIEEQVIEVPVIPVSVEVNGNTVVFKDQEPIITALVPIRGVFESLGYTIEWNSSTETAKVFNSVYNIVIKKGEYYFTNNGVKYDLDIPSQIINGRFMLPPKPVLESVNCNVKWDNDRNVIVITARSDGYSVPTSKPTAAPTPTPKPINTAIYDIWTNLRRDNQRNIVRTQITFFENNTFQIHESGLGIDNKSNGSYNVNGDTLTLTYNSNDARKYSITLSDNKMILNDGSISFEFRKGNTTLSEDSAWAKEIENTSVGIYIPSKAQATPQPTPAPTSTPKPTPTPNAPKSIIGDPGVNVNPEMRPDLTGGFTFSVNSADGVTVWWLGRYNGQKDLKYYTLNFALYNQVGDPAPCTIKRTHKLSSMRITAAATTGTTLLSPNRVIGYTADCYKVVLETIDVEYMDGTKETISYWWETTSKRSSWGG